MKKGNKDDQNEVKARTELITGELGKTGMSIWLRLVVALVFKLCSVLLFSPSLLSLSLFGVVM